jgi:hypothetical protein
MRPTSPPTATLAIAVLIALAAPARAGRSIGVVVTGESWMQPQIAAQIATWLTQHGHTPVPSTIPPDSLAALNDCFVLGDQSCARSVVEKAIRAPSVLYARIDSHSNGNDAPDVILTAYLFSRGHDAISQKSSCQRCSDQSLRTASEEILQKLVGGGDLGHLSLKSAPNGARITIDGAAIGVTPLDWDLPPGKHTIQMDLQGRRASTRDHVVVSNKTDLIVMTLAAEGPAEPPSRAIPLALVIGGGVAAATGAGLIVFSPKAPIDPNKQFYYRTWPPGIAVAAGGAVLAGVGAYLLWFRSPESASAPVAAITGDSAYVGWAGRF